MLMISRNTNLVISSGKSIIWLANSSRVASNPVLQILDSGNLVLVDDMSTATQGYAWQSFDYPTDTLLPGMKIVDDNDSDVEKYMMSWTSPDDPSPGDPYESSLFVRTTLHTSGSIMQYTMNLRKDKWNLATMFPLDTCDEYASCGPNSICSPNRPIRCECLRGFAPKFQTDWDFQDWSGGCTRTRLLNCQDGDGFLPLRGVKYPDMLRFCLNTTTSLAFISGGVARLKKRAMTQNNEDLELPVMKMTTIVQATNNFSMENMIGVGGFGPVYKGNMPSGEEIAVKRLSRSSGQGLEEFRNEVMVIAKLQHRNLITAGEHC
ncbi:hypothetical protein SASPL_157097 [Salvia splendens]|uniref:Uncharacterized protein n=1 Tax=Salvia splendens TaxID=180675 RepID=A0A8X8YUV3_SALSN|nr:hypothetical protein SASPL_157097 [Salvia splendens]